MGLLTMWREARGRVLKAECQEIADWVADAGVDDHCEFLAVLDRSHSRLCPVWEAMTARQRKWAIRDGRQRAKRLYEQGDRAAALGILVAMIDLESRPLPGSAAADVREGTAILIALAEKARPPRATFDGPRNLDEVPTIFDEGP